MKSLATFLILAVAAAAPAQTTWKGLQFGASRDQIRAALSSQGIDAATSQEGSLQSVIDYQLLLPGQRRAFPFRADFRFTDAGGLMDVTLSLDLAAMKPNYAELGTDEALVNFASNRLTRALTDIYAIPIYSTAGCEPDASSNTPRPTSCTINWHGLGQSIALDWQSHHPHLYIRYQMLSPDL